MRLPVINKSEGALLLELVGVEYFIDQKKFWPENGNKKIKGSEKA